jgi:hypothetical protein
MSTDSYLWLVSWIADRPLGPGSASKTVGWNPHRMPPWVALQQNSISFQLDVGESPQSPHHCITSPRRQDELGLLRERSYPSDEEYGGRGRKWGFRSRELVRLGMLDVQLHVMKNMHPSSSASAGVSEVLHTYLWSSGGEHGRSR